VNRSRLRDLHPSKMPGADPSHPASRHIRYPVMSRMWRSCKEIASPEPHEPGFRAPRFDERRRSASHTARIRTSGE
jgi:hypothetical protein